jgi:signal transduction histidine kinase
MLRIKDYPISKQLIWMNMLVSGVALLAACAAFYIYDSVTSRETVLRNLSTQAQIIASNAASALKRNDPQPAQNALSAFQGSRRILYAGIYSPEGRPLATYSRDPNVPAPSVPEISPGKIEAHWFEDGEMSLERAIIFRGKPVGIVLLKSDLRVLNQRLRGYAVIVAVVLSVSLMVALLVSWRSQRVISAPLVRLAEVARTVSGKKNYSVRATSTDGRDEVTTLIQAFNEMLAQIQKRDSELQEAHDNLEARVHQRTAELARAEHNLRALSRRLLKTQDEERRRIARELHEGSGQMLAALFINLSFIQSEAAKWDPEALKTVAESLNMVEGILKDMRSMSYLLHPPLLEEAGLDSALRWFVERFAERSRVAVNLDIPPNLGRLPMEAEIAIFRIVQESLTNVQLHSGSPQANIRLTRDSGEIELEVRDEGKGMPGEIYGANPLQPGTGIQGMHERVRQLGGRLEIESGIGGTVLTAIIPLASSVPSSASPAA